MSLDFVFEREKMYIYPWYLADMASVSGMDIIAPLNVKEIFVFVENNTIHIFYDKESTDKIGQYFFDRLKDDKNYINEVITKIRSGIERLDAFSVRLSSLQEVTKMNSEQIVALCSEYEKIMLDVRVWGWLPGFLDAFHHSYLTEYTQKNLENYFLKNDLPIEDVPKYYSILTSSNKISTVQQEELDRIKLFYQISQEKNFEKVIYLLGVQDFFALEQDYSEIYKKIENHRRGYAWLTYGYSGPELQLEQLTDFMLDTYKSGDLNMQKEKIENHFYEIKKHKEDIIKKISLPEELQHMCNVSAEIMYIKDYRKGGYHRSYVAMRRVYDELARRLGVSQVASHYLALHEVGYALANKKEFQKKLNERSEYACYHADKKGMQIWGGDQAREVVKNFLENNESHRPVKDDHILKGSTAYPGKVKGIAKIVILYEDVGKMEEGDVLVSSSTNPDLILAMKKAAAFVTDTGGIVSHAAIVSREMKKPCVVGTKFATSIIKDGDMVEVDADKGLVKILN